jgi:hypothetical protein
MGKLIWRNSKFQTTHPLSAGSSMTLPPNGNPIAEGFFESFAGMDGTGTNSSRNSRTSRRSSGTPSNRASGTSSPTHLVDVNVPIYTPGRRPSISLKDSQELHARMKELGEYKATGRVVARDTSLQLSSTTTTLD